MEITIQDKGLAQLEKTLKDTPKRIPKETATAINKTAKVHATAIGKELRTKVNVTVKGSKQAIELGDKANKNKLATTVTVKKLARPSLKEFKAKQTKAGVKYSIEKGGERGHVTNAFGPKIDKLGNHVYVRTTHRRGPLLKLRGPNMVSVYKKHNMEPWSKKLVRVQLQKEIDRRVQFILFKQNQEARTP